MTESTFKIMHGKLSQEEKMILPKLPNVRRRIKQTVDVTLESQAMTLSSRESLKSWQVQFIHGNKRSK